MRPLQFRAVFKGDLDLGHGKVEKGLMFYSEKIEEGLFFIMSCDRECRYKCSSSFVDSDWIIMLCTGLFDRNRRSIWEGDLVDWFSHDGQVERGEIVYSVERARFEIRFSDGENWGFNADEAATRFEVRGNAYEKVE